MTPKLAEGDILTMPDVIGLYPDGTIAVHHGAPQECLAQWRAGKEKDGPFPMELVKPGRRPETPPTPHHPGCGCGR